MTKNTQLFTEEQLDFIQEMMNIGVGNASTALHQLVQCRVDLIRSKVHVRPISQASSILDNPLLLVACVRMAIVGEQSGDMYFILPEESRKELVSLAENALPGLSTLPGLEHEEREAYAVSEIGNILCGVYTAAIHDFCGLNIYHTIPTFAIDMVQSLLDETLIKTSRQTRMVILIENEFAVNGRRVETLLIISSSADSVRSLIDALGEAKKAYGSA